MLISRSDIERLFSVNDVIDSGGRISQFLITDILDDLVRIQPTQSPTKSRLRYNKLSVVVDSFASVDANKIEYSVGKLLKSHGLQDTQNESYLYGFAREYLYRSQNPTLTMLERELEREVSKSKLSSASDRQNRLKTAPHIPEQVIVKTKAFRRNADVITEVLIRAKGICEICKQPAPFNRKSDDSPYLEVHHTIPLSAGGEDTVANAIALCPNCHRKSHFG